MTRSRGRWKNGLRDGEHCSRRRERGYSEGFSVCRRSETRRLHGWGWGAGMRAWHGWRIYHSRVSVGWLWAFIGVVWWTVAVLCKHQRRVIYTPNSERLAGRAFCATRAFYTCVCVCVCFSLLYIYKYIRVYNVPNSWRKSEVLSIQTSSFDRLSARPPPDHNVADHFSDLFLVFFFFFITSFRVSCVQELPATNWLLVEKPS